MFRSLAFRGSSVFLKVQCSVCGGKTKGLETANVRCNFFIFLGFWGYIRNVRGSKSMICVFFFFKRIFGFNPTLKMINKNPSIIKVALRAIHISQERVNLVQFKPMLRVLSDTTLKSQEQSLKFLKAIKFLYKFKFDL